jgi:glycerophosphoryl diester phosphodiesterase
VALGVDGLEFDVHMTADGELVVIHDPTVDRTTNGSGPVSRLTLKQIKAFDAGYRFAPATYPYRDRGLSIPTVAEVLDLTASLPLIIEVKALEAAEPLLALVKARHDEHRVTFGSFVTEALEPFRRAALATTAALPEVRALLVPAVFRFRPRMLPFTMLSIPPQHRGLPVPVAALTRYVAPAGVSVSVWTVNEPRKAMAYWRRGVRGILTDDPAKMLSARRQLG